MGHQRFHQFTEAREPFDPAIGFTQASPSRLDVIAEWATLEPRSPRRREIEFAAFMALLREPDDEPDDEFGYGREDAADVARDLREVAGR